MSIRGFLVLSSTCSRLVKPSTNLLKFVNATVLEVTSLPKIECKFSGYNQIRHLSTNDADTLHITHTTEPVPKKERAKTPETPKITLLDSNNNISVCTMQEAERIAHSKKLRLVQVVDSKLKTQRPTFKLMSEAEYLAEELREKQKAKEQKKNNLSVKGQKLATISSCSSDHDVGIKIKKAVKWLEKKYEIRVIIVGRSENSGRVEEIYKQFERTFKDIGRIVEKKMSKNNLKFQILSPKIEDPVQVHDKNDSKEEYEVTEKEEVDNSKLEAVKESM